MDLDLSLYLVTEPELNSGRSIIEVVRAAVKGGVTAVQLREKTATTREFIEKAKSLKAILKPVGVPLIINDKVDIALVVGAEGVHIGDDDMSYDDARRLLGTDVIIGVSVQSVADAVAISGSGVDYVAVSPVFSTPTKPDHAPPLGLDGIRNIRAKIAEPIVAIGGINETNAADVIVAGANGIAVVSAITQADNPCEAARKLRGIVG